MMTTNTPEPGRRWHDMGGKDAEAIKTGEHDYALWEKRVDALMVLCWGKQHFTVDGLRRALEDMGPETFETMTYYERWIASITQNLIETGAFTVDELNARMDSVRQRGKTYGEASLNGRHDG